MAQHSSAGSFYIGVCKCCLSDGSYMDMWGEYFSNGEREIYGEMLAECFGSLLLEQSEEGSISGVELICEACVKRLRDAYHFRNLVITSFNIMTNFIKTEPMDEVDPEPEDPKVEFEEYEEVEYLEDINEDGDESLNLSRVEDTIKMEQEPTKQRKWPKKKKRSEIKRPYFNYSMEDLWKSVEMVTEKKMSIQRASKLYNVPRSSINNWIKNEKRDKSLPKDQKQLNNERQYKFMSEVKQLLQLTNATIYKTRATRLHCAYCPADSKPMSSGDELREHVSEVHWKERVSRVDIALRPHWFYEIIKLDIDGLRCTECDIAIPNWPDLFEHLNSDHGLIFTEVHSKLVPYILDESNRCALCGEACKNYHLLDAHMNSHYKNYICNKCGDTFLTSMRLQKHVETHGNGRHPCDLCGKVFTLAKYMRKHRRQYHALEPFMKCLYCDEKFHRSHDRHLHVIDQHPDKVKYITCEICGKTFDWSPYYFAHMRKKHNQNLKHKCEECGSTFATAALLQRHSNRHYTRKEFQCEICPKSYTTKYILQAHLKLHEIEEANAKTVN